MNFLIAILSYTFENMQQISIFKYKVNVYKYCERYLIAFDDPSFGEFVIHAPPICLFTSIMIPFILVRPIMPKVTKVFSYMIYWIENVIFVVLFLFYEIVLLPVVFAKTFLNIITCSVGLFTIMFQCMLWLFSGLFFAMFLIARDIFYLIKILSMHQGCR